MNGIEHEALRFQHAVARFNVDLRRPLAQIRQVEHQQATVVNWLIGSDHSPLETTIGYEQTAIELTAGMALREPDNMWRKLCDSVCWKISITFIAIPPYSTDSKVRTRTTLRSPIPTSCPAGLPTFTIATRMTTSADRCDESFAPADEASCADDYCR